jgi:hypothetical protein
LHKFGKKIRRPNFFEREPNKIIKADEAIISSGLVDSFSLVDMSM